LELFGWFIVEVNLLVVMTLTRSYSCNNLETNVGKNPKAKSAKLNFLVFLNLRETSANKGVNFV